MLFWDRRRLVCWELWLAMPSPTAVRGRTLHSHILLQPQLSYCQIHQIKDSFLLLISVIIQPDVLLTLPALNCSV